MHHNQHITTTSTTPTSAQVRTHCMPTCIPGTPQIKDGHISTSIMTHSLFHLLQVTTQDADMIRVMPIWIQTATTHHTLLVIPMRHTSTHIVPYLEAPCELIGTFGTTTTA